MGAHVEALIASVLMAPLDSRYTQVGFNFISVQVCLAMQKKNWCMLKKLPLQTPKVRNKMAVLHDLWAKDYQRFL